MQTDNASPSAPCPSIWGMPEGLSGGPVSEKLLRVVQRVRSHIPGWRRSLSAAATEAADKTPDFAKLERQLRDPGSSAPRESAEKMRETCREAGTSLEAPLGDHAHLLAHALDEAAKWWRATEAAVCRRDAADVIADAQSAIEALDAAMQHALFLTFLDDVRDAHTGESRRIDDYAQGWGLSTAAIDTLWQWLLEDRKEFDGKELPIALDSVNRCAYRKSESNGFRLFTAAAPLWVAALVFGLIALLFAVLHLAGLTSWPHRWGWKLLVLLLFVALGALAHIGARALDVNFDDPMKVYDAGNIIDWLSLRWLAVMRLYVPVTVVVASLWGAGNIPTSFQKLGTALLAGYSADSATRAALSKLQSSASGKKQQTASG